MATVNKNIQVKEEFLRPAKSNHGEVPCYDQSSGTTYFVDMEPHCSIHKLVNQDQSTYEFATLPNDTFCTAVFPVKGDSEHLLVGGKLSVSIAKWPKQSRGELAEVTKIATIADFDPELANENWEPVRLNESTTDAKGRLWMATCLEGETKVPGQLFVLGKTQLHRIPLSIKLLMPNAMAFSPAADYFYLGCSIQGKVWRFPCNLDASPDSILGEPTELINIEKPAVPDGMTVDEQGRLYLSIFNGGRIQVYNGEGKELYSILLPTQSPTCPAFVGSALDQLFITTHAIDEDMRKEVLDSGKCGSASEIEGKWPHRDGRVYIIHLSGVKGLAKHPFVL